MAYKHGVFGQITDSIVSSTRPADEVVAYIGTAPIHLIPGYADLDLINTPIKISNLTQAKQNVGYSEDFASFTLCEAMAQHFDNPNDNVGPIYLINVLDPATHCSASKTKTATPENNKVILEGENIILDTIAIEDKTSDDFTVEYSFSRKQTTITFAANTTTTVTITYKEIDPSKVTAADIVGETTASGVKTGLDALDLLYQKHNAVLNLLAAPGWSHIPAVYMAMCAKAQNLNGHWNSFVIADLPIVDGDNKIDTIAKAIEWKNTHGYTSRFSQVCWPKAKDNLGRSIHMSAAAAAAQMSLDLDNNNIPFESASNKAINILGLDFGDSPNQGYDQITANDLNEKGITTAIYRGTWVLWGPHPASYTYNTDMDALDYFVSNIRMCQYLVNQFQIDHAAKIDEPMTLELRNEILFQERSKLDYLMRIGALIGTNEVNRIDFIELENPMGNILNGDFVFSLFGTVTPPFKSGTVKVTYTDAGLAALYEE